jgi:glutathione S-transferase
MKLFTHPGASSMHVHILLHEIGAPFEIEVINVTTKTRADGSDYREIAARGMVPLLRLDDGTDLTENVVVAQYVCDLARREDLMPAARSLARYRVMEWQSFVAAELHKGFSPLFWPIDDTAKAFVRERLLDRLKIVDAVLEGRAFLTGDTFTAADAYLFVIASWALFFQFDLSALANLRAFLARVGQRSSVRAALAAEGEGLVRVQAA